MCFSINVRIKLRKCGFVPKKSTFVCTCILLLCSNSKVSPRIGLRRELFAPVKGLNFQKKPCRIDMYPLEQRLLVQWNTLRSTVYTELQVSLTTRTSCSVF